MVVDINAGPEQVRAYVKQQAAKGLAHVKALVHGEGDAIIALIADLSDDAAAFSPGPGGFSVLQVVQHVNGSFERSIDRLKTLTGGRPFVYEVPRAGPGSIPSDAPESFGETCDAFIAGMAGVMAVLEAADPKVGLELTWDHVSFGPFNWIEWAVYSHHVHAHDHRVQIEKIKTALDER